MFADPMSFEQLSTHTVNLCIHSGSDMSAVLFTTTVEDAEFPELAETPVFKTMNYISDLERPYNTEEFSEQCAGMKGSSILGYLFCLCASSGQPELTMSRIMDAVAEYVTQWNEYARRFGFTGPRNKIVTFDMLNNYVDGHKYFATYTNEILKRI